MSEYYYLENLHFACNPFSMYSKLALQKYVIILYNFRNLPESMKL